MVALAVGNPDGVDDGLGDARCEGVGLPERLPLVL